MSNLTGSTFLFYAGKGSLQRVLTNVLFVGYGS